MHVRAMKRCSSALCLLLLALLVLAVNGGSNEGSPKTTHHKSTAANAHGNGHAKEHAAKPVPCTCGIFLSGQFKKGSKAAPKGEPVITEELETFFAHNSIGQRQCANKCIETVIKYLPKSADIICSTIDRDCLKEKAYLFTKNYDSKWTNSNMSAGRAFCCKDNKSYKCPTV